MTNDIKLTVNPDLLNSTTVNYTITPYLRYVKKAVYIMDGSVSYEKVLQQKWQGSDGSEIWHDVETIEAP